MAKITPKQRMASTWLGLLILAIVAGSAYYLIRGFAPQASTSIMMPNGMMTMSPSPSSAPTPTGGGSCEKPEPGIIGALCVNVTYSGAYVHPPAPEVALSLSGGSLLVPNCRASQSPTAGMSAKTKSYKYIFQTLLLPDLSHPSSTSMYYCLNISSVTPQPVAGVKTPQASKCEPYLGTSKASVIEVSLSRDAPFESAGIDMKCI